MFSEVLSSCIIDPICRYAVILAWFCPCSTGWFWPIILFYLRDINLTLDSCPPRRHVVRRDSVGVESSRSVLKSECADIFHQSFLWLLRHTDEPQRGRDSCLWLQSRSVLSSFGVVLMSCRVNFHVVRTALQSCIIIIRYYYFHLSLTLTSSTITVILPVW